MKRKRRTIRRSKGHAARKPSKQSWPPFFDPAQVRFLVERVRSAGRNEAEASVFLQILRRAYEDTLELEALYRELPGVLRNEPDAVRRFAETFMYSRPSGMGGKSSGGGWNDRIGYQPMPDGADFRFCDRPSLIKPYSIFEIAEGIHHVVRGDRTLYGNWTATLRGLRDKGARLERFFQLGMEDRLGKGGGRLGDELRRLGRDSKITPDDNPMPGSGEDLWPLPGGGNVTWPPGQEIQPWPDQGMPGGYHDFCYVIEPCLDQAIDGLGGVSSPPVRTWASGITSIEPNRVCLPATVTIRGAGFGNTQPNGVGIVVGDREVEVLSWSDSTIRIRIPLLTGAFQGCVGFIDKLYDDHLAIWESSGGGRARSDVEGFVSRCTGTPPHGWVRPDSSRMAPCTGVNLLGVGRPTAEFAANGAVGEAYVEPNVPIVLSWHVHNADSIRIRRTSTDGPPVDVTDPTGDMIDIGVFAGTQPADAVYELVARNACGSVTTQVTVHLRDIPALSIDMEVTQGIQVFWRPGADWNSLATIAGKDTIVRVYVSADRGGFLNDEVADVTGTLDVDGTQLLPINGITPTSMSGTPFIMARRRDLIDRSITDHTLNFRIPAALASGTRKLKVRVIAPAVGPVTPTASQDLSWTWRDENALRVRYVRVSDDRSGGTGSTPSDDEAKFTVQRAFDMLPSPPTDIAAARIATWSTRSDFTAADGPSGLLDELDDQHDCSTWEWLWAWTGLTQCPDADNAYWIGLTTPFNRGLAGVPGNTSVACIHLVANGRGEIPRTTPAHEMSHNLGLRHVNRTCGGAIGGAFYDHPNNGDLQDVPFDPFYNVAVAGSVQDYMSYGCTVWTSADSWGRLQNII
jgi:hypothetical protein